MPVLRNGELLQGFQRDWHSEALTRGRAPQRTMTKARTKAVPSLEIELTADVERLGSAGDRVLVKPGMMRNHLYPKRKALYVVRGRALALDGQLGPLPSATATTSTPSTASAPSTSGVSRSVQLQLDEAKVAEELRQLSDSSEPLRFARRTRGKDVLYGTVTTQDVLVLLQSRGLQLQELQGEFMSKTGDSEAVDRGRIKKTGEYLRELLSLFTEGIVRLLTTALLPPTASEYQAVAFGTYPDCCGRAGAIASS